MSAATVQISIAAAKPGDPAKGAQLVRSTPQMWIARAVLLLLVIGFPIALIFA